VDHIKCAAFELPFTDTEEFGRHSLQEVLGVLAEQGLVHCTSGVWSWTNESYPADAVSLRSVSSDNFVVVDTTQEARVIGETDFTSGPTTLHPKAIYIVEGKLYQVERFDFEGRKAFVREIDCDYYTTAITYSKVTPIDTFETDGAPAIDRAPDGAGRLQPSVRSHGEVHVVSRVVGFKKIKFYTNENVGSGELDLPEQQMHTTAYWLTMPASVMALLPYASDDRRDGVVGLAFALKQVAQLLLMCDGHDIGISISGLGVRESGFGQDASGFANPASRITDPDGVKVYVYDNYPGGIGFSAPLFQMHDELVRGTRHLIADCQCESGCPGCVGPIGYTGPLAKVAALRILDLVLAATKAIAGVEAEAL
jgi:DEAD/DEAH box helicase domain-containing protein